MPTPEDYAALVAAAKAALPDVDVEETAYALRTALCRVDVGFRIDTALARIRSGDEHDLDLEGISALIDAGYILCSGDERRQIVALWTAGWQPEITLEGNGSPYPAMYWAWRRPPRRFGNPGRRYLSTGQAHGAMMREDVRGRMG